MYFRVKSDETFLYYLLLSTRFSVCFSEDACVYEPGHTPDYGHTPSITPDYGHTPSIITPYYYGGLSPSIITPYYYGDTPHNTCPLTSPEEVCYAPCLSLYVNVVRMPYNGDGASGCSDSPTAAPLAIRAAKDEEECVALFEASRGSQCLSKPIIVIESNEAPAGCFEDAVNQGTLYFNEKSAGTSHVDDLEETVEIYEYCASEPLSPIPAPSCAPSQSLAQPSSLPIAIPTNLPSVSRAPTKNPSSAPTQLPIPVPTKLPIPAPTHLPTPLPTTSPIPAPTQLPTLEPTFSPTPIPTPSPTESCGAGEGFNATSGTCYNCSKGRAVDNSGHAPSTTEDGWLPCVNCQPGYIAPRSGMASCLICEGGKFASSDRTQCVANCPVGQYERNDSCVDCEAGKYAPLEGSISCLKCPTGKAVHTEGASSCIDCEAGFAASIEGLVNCSSCTAGKYASSSGSEECFVCPPGFFSGKKEAIRCEACSAGQHQPSNASSGCSPCATGRAQISTGQSHCLDCSAGTFSASEGQVVCSSCSAGKFVNVSGESACIACKSGTSQPATGQTSCSICPRNQYSNSSALSCNNCPITKASEPGSEFCDRCDSNYFPDENERDLCLPCPSGAFCPGGLTFPAPEEGFWVDRSKLAADAQYVYRCPRDTCKGVDDPDICWTAGNWTTAACSNSDTMLCHKGSAGPLCGYCIESFVYSSFKRACISCDNNFLRTVLLICFFAVLLGTVAALYFRFISLPIFILKLWVVQSILQLDGGCLRVLYNTFQIVQSVSWTIDVPFPYPFSALMDTLSIFSFEFISMDCYFKDSDHFTAVLLWSIVPFLLGSAVFFVFGMRWTWISCMTTIPDLEREHMKHRIFTEHIFMGLLLTYLVTPPVLQVLFQFLDCFELQHSGDLYLRIDTSIRCDEAEYEEYQGYTIIFILIYLSIPMIWVWLLWNKRELLNSKQLPPTEALHLRQSTPELMHLRFLFDPYRLDAFLFEPFEMYRRVVFISVLPLVSVRSERRAATGMLFALLSLAVYRELEPFMTQTNNVLLVLAQYVLLLTFGSGLVIETELSKGLSPMLLGSLLVIINMSVLLVALGFAAARSYREHKDVGQWRRALDSQEFAMLESVMLGHGFSPNAASVTSNESRKVAEENQKKSKPTTEEVYQRHQDVLNQHLVQAKDIVLDKRIGAGAFGEVFKGSFLGQATAIKTMLEVTEENARSFRAEILLTGVLRHPNIVIMMGACWERDLTALLLEWVPGGSLADFLSKKGLDWNPLLRLTLDIARGMEYLHGRQFYDEESEEYKSVIIHRDLKTENVLVTDFVGAKISVSGLFFIFDNKIAGLIIPYLIVSVQDFGTSRAKAEEDSARMTAVGTPLFCAPEIMRGEPYDESVDVYSFGILLLDMAVDEEITDFFTERYRISLGKKRTPSIIKALRAVSEDGWRPQTKSRIQSIHAMDDEEMVLELESDPLSFAPLSIRNLIGNCCDHDPQKRLSFTSIIRELLGPITKEIMGAPTPFMRHAPLLEPEALKSTQEPEPTDKSSSDAASKEQGFNELITSEGIELKKQSRQRDEGLAALQTAVTVTDNELGTTI